MFQTRPIDNFRLLSELALAVAPIFVLQMLIYFVLLGTDQMADLLQSVNEDLEMRIRFLRGSAINILFFLVVSTWRVSIVEDRYLSRQIPSAANWFLFFKLLIAAIPAFWLTFYFSVNSFFSAEQLESIDINSGNLLIKWALVYPYLLLFFGGSFYIYLGHKLKHNPKYKISSWKRLNRIVGYISKHRKFFFYLIWFLVIPGLFWQADKAPDVFTTVVIFLWSAIILFHSLADSDPLFRFCGVVIFLSIFFGTSYGVRDVRTLTTSAQLSEEWQNSNALGQSKEGPIFLISSDGGGIRAAYWTTSILGEIAKDYPDFTKNILAMSGASGGSVGAGLFAALLAAKVPDSSLQSSAATILKEDYITSATAYLLSRDIFTSGICHREQLQKILTFSCGDDRIIALEKKMERAFAEVTGVNTLAEPALKMNNGHNDRPHVFFNTTEVGSGRPYILSTFPLSFMGVGERIPIPLIVNRMRLSTAMFLSARFPIISPDGKLPVSEHGSAGEIAIVDPDSDKEIVLIDGGYADNTGALPLLGLLQTNLLDRERVFIISITNDPSASQNSNDYVDSQICDAIPPLRERRTDASEDSKGSGLRLLVSPLATLNGVREENSENRRRQLKRLVGDDHFIQVNLPACKDKDPVIPLGWTLSKTARSNLDRKAELLMTNSNSLKQFLASAFSIN